jgi:DNA-binding NtrC family response regulator
LSESNSRSAGKKAVIFIVGQDQFETRSLADALAADYDVGVATDTFAAVRRLQKEQFNAIVFDLPNDGSDPASMLLSLQQVAPDTPIIIVSGPQDAQLIVKAVKSGAFDFITKPYPPEKIRASLHRALENRSLKKEIDYLRREQDIVYDFDQIIAVSPSMREIIKTLRQFSRSDANILISGETGTGKSFLSGSIHFNSPRRHKAFVKINCANIPETLLESELFGHEAGAFTGADRPRAGRFEQADGGTIFLDEFCELGLGLQAGLLRAIEEKTFERLGGNRTIRSDTRIIAATNRDIEAFVRNGGFREDLYYRTNVLRIHLPPLRERTACIEPLAGYLLEKLTRSLKKKIRGFEPEVIDMFRQYAWPGNIRQLSNTVERAVLLENCSVIRPASVSLPDIDDSVIPVAGSGGLKLSNDRERQMIIAALKANLWIQKDAARQLNITPRALNYRIKKLGITHPRWRKNK